MSDTYSPAEAAERSGFSLDTLRYYERIGLLPPITRTSTGHRRFSERDLEWLGMLRCLRDTGMTIAQLRCYAEQARAGEGTIPDRLALLVEHAARVEGHIARLREQQERLRRKIDWYSAMAPAATAPSVRPTASVGTATGNGDEHEHEAPGQPASGAPVRTSPRRTPVRAGERG
ncbi:MerR family transcriptional regulator [Streptomyces alkaliphilus]|uniref:MerR family transcriptional regulator n=1 Tax=Streptomyces alkaliphilus TaxID=1472722 RepID=A0A7W3TFE8_9ACTN|nr:MerR family transcriptional regulator [Streptomyces alkaliphilus]MBB0245839.1 MerR family transcriptional regulator [Streptomyces alkaliphilus]